MSEFETLNCDQFSVEYEVHEAYMGLDCEPMCFDLKVTIKDEDDRVVEFVGTDSEIQSLIGSLQRAMAEKIRQEEEYFAEDNELLEDQETVDDDGISGAN